MTSPQQAPQPEPALPALDSVVIARPELSGMARLRDPLLNRGTAFTEEERDRYELHGLIPACVETLEIQLDRALKAFEAKTTDLERYIYLRRLQDDNETLFYALVTSNLERMMPVIYTPVVGEACQHYSTIYRSPRGLYISYPNRDRIEEMLDNSPIDDVKAIVVTDGERILGFGDLGAGGMGIPIGKLSLYTACGGINPANTLPIMLDSGTNNQALLNNPLYIGWDHPRVTGPEYDRFIEGFVAAVQRRFPGALLQWEDFAKANATKILERYRDKVCSFNDDIQGTAAVTTGSLMAAVSASGTRFKDQVVAILGGGSAGCGIGEQVVKAMMADGLSEADARNRIYLVDRDGLLRDEKRSGYLDFQERFVHSADSLKEWRHGSDAPFGLRDVVRNAKPTILIGVCGQPNQFTKDIVQEMSAYCARPIVFPLSNPTSCAEAHPADVLAWSGGKAIVATGSPFAPVEMDGREIPISQCNNSYIFPGLGLGVIASGATRVTDGMLMAAANALGAASPMKQDQDAPLLPPLRDIVKLSKQIALEVGKAAQAEGVAPKLGEPELRALIEERFWKPVYG